MLSKVLVHARKKNFEKTKAWPTFHYISCISEPPFHVASEEQRRQRNLCNVQGSGLKDFST
jgi:hypothetical protein